jgi:hypothetical protein
MKLHSVTRSSHWSALAAPSFIVEATPLTCKRMDQTSSRNRELTLSKMLESLREKGKLFSFAVSINISCLNEESFLAESGAISHS